MGGRGVIARTAYINRRNGCTCRQIGPQRRLGRCVGHQVACIYYLMQFPQHNHNGYYPQVVRHAGQTLELLLSRQAELLTNAWKVCLDDPVRITPPRPQGFQ